MGIDKTFDALTLMYYWPNMYKELNEYVNNCVTCQTRSLKKPTLQETNIPPYPFAKIGLDLSGPYPKSLSGNRYIIGFVDWYSGWCITTSVAHPQSNSKVECFHRTLHDVMSKRLDENYETWVLHLNQVLAAIRFNVNESTKFSPYHLLYNRDPVLPLGNILKSCRCYLGEELHKIGLQQQHKSFILVHNHLKKAKKRHTRYADRNAKYIEF